MILHPADLAQRAAERTAGTVATAGMPAGAVAVAGAMTEAVEVTVTEAVEGVTTEAVVTAAVGTETVAAEIIRIVGGLVAAGRKGAVYERENRKICPLSGGCGKSVSVDIFEYFLP